MSQHICHSFTVLTLHWIGLVQHSMVQYGTGWYGTVWYSTCNHLHLTNSAPRVSIYGKDGSDWFTLFVTLWLDLRPLVFWCAYAKEIYVQNWKVNTNHALHDLQHQITSLLAMGLDYGNTCYSTLWKTTKNIYNSIISKRKYIGSPLIYPHSHGYRVYSHTIQVQTVQKFDCKFLHS